MTVLSVCAVGAAAKPATMAEVLAASAPADWRRPDPENTLYVELASGRVVIELAPAFAPLHTANIKALARAHYYDGLAIMRVQDDYVVQWGDPNATRPDAAQPVPAGIHAVAAEFAAVPSPQMHFTALPDGDVYAPHVGFTDGFPSARDAAGRSTWLAHCYGMVGVGRDEPAESDGTELYAVIGHAPRHLDRNVALVGRVIQGIELLSSLPRGSGEMGFYAKGEAPVPIKSVRVAADVPAAARSRLELLRTDTRAFQAVVEARRNRTESWFKTPIGHIELCNVPLPARRYAPADGTQSSP